MRNIAKTLKADDFEVIKEIGEGNFSKIILVEYKKTEKKYAMKIINKPKVKSMRKELDVLHEKLTLYRIFDHDRGKNLSKDEQENANDGDDQSNDIGISDKNTESQDDSVKIEDNKTDTADKNNSDCIQNTKEDAKKELKEDSKTCEIQSESQNPPEDPDIENDIKQQLRVVKLCATFQDEANLYLVTENLASLNSKELWEYSRTFGLENHDVIKYTFYHI